jgi:hydroxymethylpyrimidine pyrophosphatase-like HAD family hydrolase
MSPPIVCLDFDGTLVDNQGWIHPGDVEILSTEHHIVFIPTTGRPLSSVRRVFERNGLFIGRPIPFPLVLQNGAILYRPDEVLHAQHIFAPDIQTALIELALTQPQLCFLWLNLAEVSILWPNETGMAWIRRFDLDPHPFISSDQHVPFTKMMVIGQTHEKLHSFSTAIAALPLECCYSLPTILEVNQAGVHKGLGLIALLAALGLKHSKIIAAGDGENDLPLFDLATLSFAPDTSLTVVRTRADHIVNVQKTGLLRPILQTIGL